MPPRAQARKLMPDSIAANTEAVRSLTSLFMKRIMRKGDKACKWHQYPTYRTEFLPIALEKFHEQYVQLYNDKYGAKKGCKIYFCVSFFLANLLGGRPIGDAMLAQDQ